MPFARLGRPESANPRPWDRCAATRLGMAALLLTACGGGANLLLPGDGEATHINILGGNNQSGRVGELLNDPLVVQVTDSRGRPVNGASVAFEFTSAGPEASIDPATATTDAKGKATAQLVLGTTIGPQTGQASVVTQGPKPPTISFTVMALPENANGITAVSGEDQTGAAGSKLRQPLVVQVTDGFGNPISGVRINWSAEGGGGVSDGSNLTDESGRASVERTLGPTAGPQTTLARSEGLAGSPVTFTHTATAGNASGLSIVSGNNQTATAGTRLPADLVVRLVDGEGNGVPGTAVAWVVGIGGGSVTPQNGTTDDQGRASAQWTLGPNPGQNRVDAVVSGIGIANFTATGTAGAPAALAIVTQPSGSARNGVPFERQPAIQVRDGRGNDAATSGIVITAQLSGSGGELIGTRQRATDANGRATFTDLAISGATGRRTLVFTASGYAGATSTPIDVSAIATTTTITNDSPDPSVAGSTFTVEFQVTSAGPTATGNVTVTVPDGTANCSATLQNGSGSCQLTLAKVGDRTLKATYSGGPGFNGSSDTEGHVVKQATPQNKPPHADYNWHCEHLTCHFTDASEDDDGTITSRSWNFGDGTVVANELNPSHTYTAAGDYTVILTVTDNGGLTDDAQDVVDPQAPPPQVLDIGRQPSSSADLGQPFDRQPEIRLRAGGRDIQRAGVVVTASIASGSGALGGTTTAATDEAGRAEFSNLSISGATGPHTLIFSADGFASVTSNSIEVRKAASQTDINSPDRAVVGTPVRVDFSVTSGGGTPTGTVTVAAEDGPREFCTGSVADGFCMLTFTAPGDRNIRATYAGDERFDGSSDGVGIEVNEPENVAPTAAFTAPTCTVNVPCEFSAAGSSDTDGQIVGWDWTFSEGDPQSGEIVSHVYTTAGGHSATLTVTDNDGAASDPVTQPITVN